MATKERAIKKVEKDAALVFKGPPRDWWSDDRPACLATYNILEGDEFLNQFDAAVLSFNKAPEFLLANLSSMFPDGSAIDQRGRAMQIARGFLRFIKEKYSRKTEDAAFDGPTIQVSLAECLLQKGATIAHLAFLIDGFIIFPGEKK